MRYFFGQSERPSLFMDRPSNFCGSVFDSKGNFHTLEFGLSGSQFSLCFDADNLNHALSLSVRSARTLFVEARQRHGSDARPAKSIELVFRVPFSCIIYSIKITKTYIDLILCQDKE